MRYGFDAFGWYSSAVNAAYSENSTDIAPPLNIPQGSRANFTGNGWAIMAYSEIVQITSPEAMTSEPWLWFIDQGPFYDRFGAAKMAVLTSTDPVVHAILNDTSIRKWIDLKRDDVARSIAYIGSKIPSLTAELQSSILTSPVLPDENLALRKIYFNV